MIRKVITTVIISLVTLNYIQAQDKFKRELSLGASFGTTFSKVSFAQTKVQQKMKMGYTGGLTLRWITEKNLGLQAELNFIQHGWDEKFEDQPQYKYSRTINYFELPILTHIYFGSKRFRVFVNLGPKIGYAFGEKTDENLNGAKPNTENEQTQEAGSIFINSTGDYAVVRVSNFVQELALSSWRAATIMPSATSSTAVKKIIFPNRLRR